MWIYDGEQIENADLDKHYGFVYCIENLKTGKKYIGKKLLLHRKTRQVKGKKKKFLAESDWKTYWGSSKALLEDVEELGEENFRRTILSWCQSKGEASYLELHYQMKYHVLLDNDYYNNVVNARIHSSHVKNVSKEIFKT